MMHFHTDFLDTGFLNCKVEKNNLAYQEIPGFSPVDIFILCYICYVLNDWPGPTRSAYFEHRIS